MNEVARNPNCCLVGLRCLMRRPFRDIAHWFGCAIPAKPVEQLRQDAQAGRGQLGMSISASDPRDRCSLSLRQ
jgi:hypothetical protein